MTNQEIARTAYTFRAWSTGRYWVYTVRKGDQIMPTMQRGYRTQREAENAARRSIKRYVAIDGL